MVNTVRVNANHGRDFYPLADHMTNLRTFSNGEICEFSFHIFTSFNV